MLKRALSRLFAARALEAPDRPTYGYHLMIRAQGADASLWLNGAPLAEAAWSARNDSEMPVTRFLKPGGNELAIQYEPYDEGAETYTAHPGVAFSIALAQSEKDIRRAAVRLFAGRFDPAADGFVPVDPRDPDVARIAMLHPERHRDGAFGVPGTAEVTATSFFNPVRKRMSGPAARKITLPFEIEPPMPVPPWTHAPVLSDGPELRRRLIDGYSALYEAYGGGDTSAVRKMAARWFDHAAVAEGWRDGAALAGAWFKRRPVQLAYVHVGPMPAPNEAALMAAEPRFNPERTIAWYDSDDLRAGFEMADADRFAFAWPRFCDDGSGALVICLGPVP